jgi:hypothetical protein
MSTEAVVVEKKPPPTFKEIMDKAAKSAVRGGTAGACAMGANVACLMWMRTTVCHVLVMMLRKCCVRYSMCTLIAYTFSHSHFLLIHFHIHILDQLSIPKWHELSDGIAHSLCRRGHSSFLQGSHSCNGAGSPFSLW